MQSSEKKSKKLLFELKNSIRDISSAFPGMPVSGAMKKAGEEYPVLITPYYLGLINQNDPKNDPIFRQCMPDAREIEDFSSSEDPLSEEKQMPVKRLIHRYPDRALVLVTNRCAVHCRFCFRKRYWKKDSGKADINDTELKNICAYLRKTPSVKEILLSGGDPLMLETDRIKKILEKIFSVKTIETVRICSRVPVTMPMRVDRDLVNVLKHFSGLWLLTHFNHPRELTAESAKACRMFIKAGIPVLSQTVLLADVNDSYETLEKLFRGLVKIGAKPHYLFHIDPVRGVRHFATGIDKGLELLREFRKNLSSIAVPTFAIDLPEGGGKVNLQADYCTEDGFKSIDGRIIRYS